MTRFDDRLAPVAVATRSGFDESVHHGAGVAVDRTGALVAAIGDPRLVVYPRSSLKPIQAHAMVTLGLELPDELLAVACASHDGSPAHLVAVRAILDQYGLDERDLANTAARPHGADARDAARAAGVGPSPIQQNCSGKHAAMLATCRINGWPIDGYLAVDHVLQVAITDVIEGLGCAVEHIGVDGCGAPAHALPLRDLAGAFSTLAVSEARVVHAMRAHPVMVAGPTRAVTRWMTAVPELMAKEGAAGVFAATMPDGRAVAFKVADGSDVARRAVTPEALRWIGVDVDALPAAVTSELRVAVLGHGQVVGEVRALPWASSP